MNFKCIEYYEVEDIWGIRSDYFAKGFSLNHSDVLNVIEERYKYAEETGDIDITHNFSKKINSQTVGEEEVYYIQVSSFMFMVFKLIPFHKITPEQRTFKELVLNELEVANYHHIQNKITKYLKSQEKSQMKTETNKTTGASV